MKLSRRALLGTAVLGTAAAATGVTLTAEAATSPAVSAAGDVVGKITVGYQGWFAAIGDGAPINGWWHYGLDWSKAPSPSNQALHAWPDVRDYTRTYPTGYGNLGNGSPATQFSDYDQQTVDTHFRWMQENDLDTAALQRFNPTGGEGPTRDAVTAKVRNSAETYGRKFYIMYDVSGWTDMQQQIKDDWTNKMKAYTDGIDYQPCVLPGDLSARQRAHGDFMWRQFYNMIRADAPAIYISMFDEYNESNQIAKTAESLAFVPTGSTFLGLDEDGTACSADYYLRLTGDGGRMLKGQIALTATRPTQPVVGSTTTGTALRSHADQKYVTASGASLIASAATPEKFTIVDAGGGNIALKAANGKYVCAENAGASPLVANRDAIGSWETFTLVHNGDGSVSFRSAANGKYVCADNAGASPLIANRDAIGAWESFDEL